MCQKVSALLVCHFVVNCGYAVFRWMAIVERTLVQVVGQVISHRVPSCVLIVDQSKLSVVIEIHEYIVFLAVVVRKHDSFSRYKIAKVLLVAWKEKVAV